MEALDYDFNLSKLERAMSGAGKGHELERRGRTIVVTGKTLGGLALLEKVLRPSSYENVQKYTAC